jgi:hypothetical protein
MIKVVHLLFIGNVFNYFCEYWGDVFNKYSTTPFKSTT